MLATQVAAGYEPNYVRLYESGELERRVEEALASLEKCRVCPWDCDVNRLKDEAEDLLDLDEKDLAEERLEATVEDVLIKFHLSGTDDERWLVYEELKRLDPDEAEDLLN